MTLVSFVVPVYKVRRYLPECLDSILGQPFGDVELIAVDDASPDGSGEILAEYAARDPRVRVITLPSNLGLGPARNVGLDAATGDYVWFVDSDDWLAEGCLPAVVDRLRALDPDVLIVDHVRVFWDGRVIGTGLARRFAGIDGTFTVRDRPDALRALHTAWNKVVRRDFLRRLGLRFGAGWYEDVSYSYPALLAADRIAVLGQVCVNYRQRRQGAITRTVGGRHFELFDHWARVFALLDDWGSAVDELRPAVFERMIWHYLVVLGNRSRVPPRLRREFFLRVVEDYHRFRPPGARPPAARGERLKHWLVAHRAWWAYRALRVVRQGAGKAVVG